MKKIAFFINNFAGGGAEKVAHNVLTELTLETEVILVFVTRIIDYPIPANCKLIYLTDKNYLNRVWKIILIPFFILKLLSIVKKNKIEVLISFMEFQNWISCGLKIIGWHGRVVISEQAAPIQVYDRNTLEGKIGLALIKIFYPYADLIIPCSEGIKYQLKKDLKVINNYSVIYNPINIDDVNKKIQNSESEIYDKFTFINVSGFRKQKNHLLLIEAFALLKDLNCELILVGNEYEIGKLVRNRCSELGISEKIRIIGFVTNPFIYLKNADCFVLSSDFEGLPNVLLEAMACNLPIVSTDCHTGPREILSPASDFTKILQNQIEIVKYGILTPIGNKSLFAQAMRLIYEDKRLISNFRKNNKNSIEKFSLDLAYIEFKQALLTGENKMQTKDENSNIIKTANRDIQVIESNINLDKETVDSFSAEWANFHNFSDEEINLLGQEYFDIITPEMVNSESIIADFGCGSGRFSKYWQNKVKTIYSIDPSNSVLVADKLLGKDENVKIIKASISEMPIKENFFDFGMSIGVLHHIPDTRKAMADCVKKIKVGGYFYVYLYYDLDNRGFLFKALWKLSDYLRRFISNLPQKIKSVFCELIALFIYMPFVIITRLAILIGVKEKIWVKIPLANYQNKSYFVIRNDSLDRFGTPLEQRFSKREIENMMKSVGLVDIVFSEKPNFWRAVGNKKNDN